MLNVTLEQLVNSKIVWLGDIRKMTVYEYTGEGVSFTPVEDYNEVKHLRVNQILPSTKHCGITVILEKNV